MLRELNLAHTNLEVRVPDVQSLTEEEYALARRSGLGASDIAIVLGVQYHKGKTLEQLIAEKKSTTISDSEKAVGKIDAVRKGRDLEPLILQKYAQLLHCEEPLKPKDMYAIKDFPYLTVNFDGVAEMSSFGYIPVEAKFVTIWGDKYYNRDRAIFRESEGYQDTKDMLPKHFSDFKEHVYYQAEQMGVPAYYYVQVQQQILGLDSDRGFLAALHDKGWELCVYSTPRDDRVIEQIKIEGWKTWKQI